MCFKMGVTFVLGALCPPCVGVLDGRGAKLRGGEILSGLMHIPFMSLIFPSSSLSSSSSFFIWPFLIFPFGLLFFFPFLIVRNLVHLFGYSCRGSTKVVWICLSWLQCNYLAYVCFGCNVTIWHTLIKSDFWTYRCVEF